MTYSIDGFQVKLAALISWLRSILPKDKQGWPDIIEKTPLPFVLAQFRTRVVPSYKLNLLAACLKYQLGQHNISIKDICPEDSTKAKAIFEELKQHMEEMAEYVIKMNKIQ